MSISRRTVLASSLAVLLLPQVSPGEEESDAETDPFKDMTPEERRAAFEAMSEEEKQALLEKRQAAIERRRAEWEAMTPEQRKAKREEIRERMRNLTPEQRAAIRKRQQRARRKPAADSPAEPDTDEQQ